MGRDWEGGGGRGLDKFGQLNETKVKHVICISEGSNAETGRNTKATVYHCGFFMIT